MEERESPVQIFLDVSKSMDYGEPDKSIASRRLAAAIAYISLCNYDRVSIACVNDKIDKFKSSLRGKNSFKEVMSLLENIEYSGTTNIYETIAKYPFRFGKGVSLVISDFFCEGNYVDMIKYLQFKKQHVYVCHILSPSGNIAGNWRKCKAYRFRNRDVQGSCCIKKPA